jgi:hypothetical protein
MVTARVTAIACGHEDAIDHNDLRHDPLAKLLLPIGSISCYTTIVSKSGDVIRRRGRPATGKIPDPFLTARVPQDTIDAIERWADSGKITRSEAIRRLLNLGLERMPEQRRRGRGGSK